MLKVYQSGKASKKDFKRMAEDFLRNRQYADAFGLTALMKDKYGEDSNLCLLNARIYKAQGQFSSAISHYTKAASYRNAILAVFTEIVDVHMNLNRFSDAENWIEKGLASYPFHLELLQLKVDVLYKLNKYEECMLVLDSILEKEPQDAKALYTKGLIYDHEKRFTKANRYFNRAAAINPEFFAPVNQERVRSLKRLKMVLITAVSVVVIFFIGQFVTFATGMVKPIVYGETIETDDILFIGETMKVSHHYRLFPLYAKKPDIKYKIDNPKIAKVTSEGKIKGLRLRLGSTSVQLVEGGKVLASAPFKVVNPEISDLTIGASDTKLVVGDTSNISVNLKMNYDQAKSPKVTYQSNQPDIISVDDNGNIKALGVGEVEITVMAGTKESSVSIYSYAKVEDITFNLPEDVKVQVGKKLTLQPVVKTTPEDGEYYPLSYRSSDSSVATVTDQGEVKGVKPGEVEISISSFKGAEKKVKISVVTKLVLERPSEVNAEIDENSGTIHLSWSYPSTPGMDTQFKVMMQKNTGNYEEVSTIKETSIVIPITSTGAEYWFAVFAVSGEYSSEAAYDSIVVPRGFQQPSKSDNTTGTRSSNSANQANNEAVDSSADQAQKDRDVEQMITLMSSVKGYWKNVSLNDADSRYLNYAVINENSSDSRKNSFLVYYLAKSYYYTMFSSFWEDGLRRNSIKLEGNKLYDTEGDAIIIQSANQIVIEFKNGFHGDPNVKSFTFIRCTKSDIPSTYLSNVSTRMVLP
ncbi:Ig-like domain-containing protein [Neobacillus sp. 114]|uniref:Ig-like domain-containing protein n=1 Tax=Neobacillus sp. 114 TaxID=3048535 RepID=UPI0024C292A7|nr:Ig-like domain-containing protein [Neobacillus sp. 114]